MLIILMDILINFDLYYLIGSRVSFETLWFILNAIRILKFRKFQHCDAIAYIMDWHILILFLSGIVYPITARSFISYLFVFI